RRSELGAYYGRANRRKAAGGPVLFSIGRVMATITLQVNAKKQVVDVEPRTLLVELLREHLRLTGTHVGCDTSQCGACTFWVDGKSVKSCAMLAVEADGASVTTIEGLSAVAGNGKLHPM